MQQLPREQWRVLLHDAHAGYISWQQFEDNQRRLHENAQTRGERRHGPPREGPALLQGLVVCGICGERMTVSYHRRRHGLVPDYRCQSRAIQRAEPCCQRISGTGIDAAIGQLLLAMITPMALEVSLAVQQELQDRLDQADDLRRKQVERAQYEANLAQRRYMQVDPDNRLVADELEADWNDKLRAVRRGREDYERQREADRLVLDEQQRQRIMSLVTDLPRLWNSPDVPQRERKRMVRLLIEDVTLIKDQQIEVKIRFKAGTTHTLSLPIPPKGWQAPTSPEVIAEIDRLLDHHYEGEVAAILNERGMRPSVADSFTPLNVQRLRRQYDIKSRYDRLRQAGLLTQEEMASRLGVSVATVHRWRRQGRLKAVPYNGWKKYLYEPPGHDAPVKFKHYKGSTGAEPPRCPQTDGGGAV